jgi:hypothetical protein
MTIRLGRGRAFLGIDRVVNHPQRSYTGFGLALLILH